MNRRSFVGTFVGACMGVVAGAWAGVRETKGDDVSEEESERIRQEFIRRIRGYYCRVTKKVWKHRLPSEPHVLLRTITIVPEQKISRQCFRQLLQYLGRADRPGLEGYWCHACTKRESTAEGVVMTIFSWVRWKGMPA